MCLELLYTSSTIRPQLHLTRVVYTYISCGDWYMYKAVCTHVLRGR